MNASLRFLVGAKSRGKFEMRTLPKQVQVIKNHDVPIAIAGCLRNCGLRGVTWRSKPSWSTDQSKSQQARVVTRSLNHLITENDRSAFPYDHGVRP